MTDRLGGEIAIGHGQFGMPALFRRDDFRRNQAADRARSENAGIDMQEFHGSALSLEWKDRLRRHEQSASFATGAKSGRER